MYSNVYIPALTLVNQNSSGKWSLDAADFEVHVYAYVTMVGIEIKFLHIVFVV